MTKQTGEACTDIDRVYAEAPYGMCKCQVLGSQVSVILATYVTAFLRH